MPLALRRLRWSSVVWTACILASVAVADARAGAWLREPGGLYARTSLLLSSTRDRWDCEGVSAAAEPFGGRYRERLWYTYLEWGATERLTLVGGFGVKDARIVEADVPDYGTRSTADLRGGARWGLSRGRWPISVEVVASIPTYPRTDPTLGIGAREQFLPVGSGTFESEWRLLAGRSLYPLPLYANLDLGYRTRGAPFGDQWTMAAEVGGTAGRFFGKGELRGLFPTGDLCSTASAGAVTFHERAWSGGGEAAFAVAEGWWLGVGAAAPFAGRNALEATQWSVSLAWERRGDRPAR